LTPAQLSAISGNIEALQALDAAGGDIIDFRADETDNVDDLFHADDDSFVSTVYACLQEYTEITADNTKLRQYLDMVISRCESMDATTSLFDREQHVKLLSLIVFHLFMQRFEH
jgi:hypothetical protein